MCCTPHATCEGCSDSCTASQSLVWKSSKSGLRFQPLNRQPISPRTGIEFVPCFPLDAWQIHNTEGCGIFDVGNLAVAFSQQQPIRPRAFSIVLFSGVVADLILCNCLEHNKPYSAKAVPDMLRNNGKVVARHLQAVSAFIFAAASGIRGSCRCCAGEVSPGPDAPRHPGRAKDARSAPRRDLGETRRIQVDCFAALHLVIGQWTTRWLEQPSTPQSQDRSQQTAAAPHDFCRPSPGHGAPVSGQHLS